MGRTNRRYLTGTRIFGCARCKSHLASIDTMISRQFNGQTGRAYLFEAVVNVAEGPAEDRHMTTGLHTVRDIFCGKCRALLGWKYDRAYEQAQKYKEGKFILEKALLREVDPIKDDMATLEYDQDQPSEDGSNGMAVDRDLRPASRAPREDSPASEASTPESGH